MNGYDFYIDENGDVVYGDIPLSAKISAFNYGDYVDYSIDLDGDGNTTNDWKIFYTDGEYVFIIAADYVPTTSSYISSTLTDAGLTTKGTYGLYWAANTNGQSVDETTLNLFKSNWTDYSSESGRRVVSTLLNTRNWIGFVDNTYADYAIGSPTVEMLVASYNAKGYTQLFINTNSSGYYIGTEEGPTTTDADLDEEGGNDLLYTPRSEIADSLCYGYWLASPSASYNYYVMCTRYYRRSFESLLLL